MSKEYFTYDGSRITITDDNRVFKDSKGCIGQINHFGEFISSDGSESFKIMDNGTFVGSNGSSGSIIHDKIYIERKNQEKYTEKPYVSKITVPLWLKLLLIFVGLPVLAAESALAVVAYSLLLVVYEEFEKGNWIPLIIFIIAILILIVLFVLLIRKIVKIIKNKRK